MADDDQEQPTPSMEEMARQYMDLWRDQLEGIAADPDINASMAQAMQMMNTGFANFAAVTEGMLSGTGEQASEDEHGDDADRHHDDSAEASSVAPRPADDVVRQLQDRIAELEKRVAELEAKSAKPSRRSAKKPRTKSA